MKKKLLTRKFSSEVAKAITLKGYGGGAISFKQAGGKIEIDTRGNIDIEGTSVNIDATNLVFKGGVMTHVPGGGGGGGVGGTGHSGSADFIQSEIGKYEGIVFKEETPQETTNAKSPLTATSSVATQARSGNATNIPLDVVSNAVHWIQLKYTDGNNNPLVDLPFVVTDSAGQQFKDVLDKDGFAHVDNVAAGTATIEFVPDYDEKVKAALEQLNQMLKEALQHAYQETKMLDKQWDKTDWMDKPVILAGSLAIGIGDAVHEFALSIVHLLQGIQKTLNSTGTWLGRYTSHHEQLHRAWDKGDIDGVKRAVTALDAMETELAHDVDSGIETGKIVALLAFEPSFYKAIVTFSYDYMNALHITATVKILPSVALNIALLLISGVGAVKQGIKGATKISAHLKQSAKLFKQKQYKKTLSGEKVDQKVIIQTPNPNKVLHKKAKMNLSDVKNKNNFITKGIFVKNVLNSPEGRALLAELKNANPNTPNNTLLRRTKEMLQSGKSLPKIKNAESSTVLYKYVPHGNNVPSYSPYFMSEKQMSKLRNNPSNIADSMALPKASEANKYDIYKIIPKVGETPKIFVSTVAETTEGIINRNGSGIQTLVPNRNLWSEPKLIGITGE